MLLSIKRITKALIRLHRCAGWSAPLLFATAVNWFSRDEAHYILTRFILMDYHIHIETISMEFSFCILRGYQSKFQEHDVFPSLKIVFILSNIADPDEMLPYAAFHLGLHCLPKYIFTGTQNVKG